MKIVSLDGAALNPGDLSWACFEQFGKVTVYPRTLTEAETIERIDDADIVLLNKVPITKAVLGACPSVKLICCLATGYNVVDTETLRKAQENPTEYRDLVVRIAGYSAYFVELGRELQDDIISRNECKI